MSHVMTRECYKGYHRETLRWLQDEIALNALDTSGDSTGEITGVCAKGTHVFVLGYDGNRTTRVDMFNNDGVHKRDNIYSDDGTLGKVFRYKP